MNSRLGKIYAKALVMIAQDRHEEPGSYLKSLKQINESMSDEMVKLITMPNVSTSIRRDIIIEISNKFDLSDTLKRFMIFLVDNGRIDKFSYIVKALGEICDKLYGRISGTAFFAVDISESDKAGISGAIEQITGKHVTLDYKVDSSILGGIVVYAGNVAYDGSVRHLLDKLKLELSIN